MLAPDVETRPWDAQLAVDAESYRTQLTYLFERSPFYRDKLSAAGVDSPAAAGGLDNIARLPLTEKRELRETCTADNPFGAHLCAAPSEIVRVYSTSGTTGTPSYIPLTAGDLDNWVTGSARSYAASGIAAGQRIVSTYNAGPFAAGAALEACDRIGLCHVPFGTGNTERLMTAIDLLHPDAAVLTPSYAAHLVEWATERGFDLPGIERRARPRGGRARRRRARLPGDARGGMGREGHRGDGHRRHRRVALGRVRGAGRDAPRRTGLRPRRADRPGDGRRARDRRRRHRRARPHAPPASRGAASAVPHARSRRGEDEPVQVWPHRAPRAVHRTDRRHAHRPRRQRLPVGGPRGRECLRSRRQRPHPRAARGSGREAGASASRQRRARARPGSGRLARGGDSRQTTQRARRLRARRPGAVGQPASQRVQVEARRALGAECGRSRARVSTTSRSSVPAGRRRSTSGRECSACRSCSSSRTSTTSRRATSTSIRATAA